MKLKLLFLLFALLFCASVVDAQVTNQNARRLRSGTADPNSPALSCVPGPPYTDTYVRTSDHSEWQCTASPSTWTKVTSGTPAVSTTPGGSDTQVQFNDGGSAFGGDAGLVYNKTTDVITETHTVGGTSADGVVIQNTTAAANGAQQWSPRLRFTGNGWRSNAGGNSRVVDWIIENQPVQGTAAPTSLLNFAAQINGGGYTSKFQIDSAGAPIFPSLAGGGTRFLQVDNNGATTATASAGIANSAPSGTIPKTVDGSGNLGASQTDDDGTDVRIGGAAKFTPATFAAIVGDWGNNGNHVKITVDDAAQTITSTGLDDLTSLVLNAATPSITATASTESLSIDGTAHTVSTAAASSISNTTLAWRAGPAGDDFEIATGTRDGVITKYGGQSPTDGDILIGDTADSSFHKGGIGSGAGISVTTGAGSVVIASNNISAVSASIGGGALLAGACASTATTVTGATVGMAVVATPNTYPGDAVYWKAYVSGADTVTVKVCAAIALTPTASTYNLRVIQ